MLADYGRGPQWWRWPDRTVAHIRTARAGIKTVVGSLGALRARPAMRRVMPVKSLMQPVGPIALVAWVTPLVPHLNRHLLIFIACVIEEGGTVYRPAEGCTAQGDCNAKASQSADHPHCLVSACCELRAIPYCCDRSRSVVLTVISCLRSLPRTLEHDRRAWGGAGPYISRWVDDRDGSLLVAAMGLSGRCSTKERR